MYYEKKALQNHLGYSSDEIDLLRSNNHLPTFKNESDGKEYIAVKLKDIDEITIKKGYLILDFGYQGLK